MGIETVIDAAKMKAAAWGSLYKQKMRVCEAAKDRVNNPHDDLTEKNLIREVRKLEAMESIQ